MKAKTKTAFKKLLLSLPFLLDKHVILLESSPDFSDNTKYVFDELIKQKLNEKYKIYWIVQNKNSFKSIHIKNVYFCNRASFEYKKIHLTAKYIIDSNMFISKIWKNQFRIHLGHGYPIKMTYEYCSGIGKINYLTTISPFFNKYFRDLFNINNSQIKTLGSPRNDGFFNDIHYHIFPEISRKKTILWMPTYRNHKNKNATKTGIHFPFGVPCINSKPDLETLNSALKKNDTLLVLKLHPAEDLSKITSAKLSNIKIFESSILKPTGPQLYDMLKDFDALITDYSSVYYDFLLTQKPIGLAIPDIEEYSKTCTLISNDITEYVKGDYIYSLKDLIDFINLVATGKDPAKKELAWALDKYHTYKDGNSSKRVIDLLLEKMEEDR